jgi:alkanesulfonate monooxygenase SsuD/methylene tetrahydromethanopterin reductase-like flavin-dependent oxidoreductase (luciferase family)
VLFAYLAAITRRLAFRPSILILPLFPTALVAKQAAELSLLSGGRFQLGAGISWNPVEYAALNQDPRTRGRRLEEQITVLRLLWTEPFPTFNGRWHHLDRIGLNRLPRSPIPILLGSGIDDAVLRRVARLADGWLPTGDPTEPMTRLRGFLAEAGRDPATFSLTSRITAGPEGPVACIAAPRRRQAIGGTDFVVGAPPDLPPAQALDRVITAKNTLAAALGG